MRVIVGGIMPNGLFADIFLFRVTFLYGPFSIYVDTQEWYTNSERTIYDTEKLLSFCVVREMFIGGGFSELVAWIELSSKVEKLCRKYFLIQCYRIIKLTLLSYWKQ